MNAGRAGDIYGGERRSSFTNLHTRLGIVYGEKSGTKQYRNGVRDVVLQDVIMSKIV